ncbi:MAG TPA: electron transport complex subunit RsxC, partial [Sedimentisphaerales bacterium]|nr:electron transport complex subunit RsxC [Sedimentisphaerales bacterium]
MGLKLFCSRTFQGGVHPPENKKLSCDCPISPGPAPKEIAVLLSQHIGAVCQPVVDRKDKVEAGQVVGRAEAFVSAPVHSPVNGTVKEIALQSHPVLGRAMAVVIEAQAQGRLKSPVAERFGADFDDTPYSAERIRSAVGQAGIVGLGGAGFPTSVKLTPNKDMPINDLILNGGECEPYITCDYRMMIEWTHQILAGLLLAGKAVDAKNIHIAIEDNKPEAVDRMKKAVAGLKAAKNVNVVVMRTRYPQGGERQLIRTLLGKNVPTAGIPPMINTLVINVATAAAIAEAVAFGNPLTHRVVTVSGRGINRTGNFYVANGTTVGEMISFCGGLKDEAVKVILGGPMMGFAVADFSTPLTKTNGAITVLTEEEVTPAKHRGRQTSCMKCGRCLDACPVNLNPTKLAHAVMYDMLEV